MLDQRVRNLVIITHLGGPDVAGGLESGGCVYGAGGNRNARFVPGIPEQARPAVPAETAMHVRRLVRGGVKPLQRVGLLQNQILPICGRVGPHVAMKPPAFAAVAIDHVHQMVMDFEPDRAAKTAARRHGFGLIWGRIHFLFSANALFVIWGGRSTQISSSEHMLVEITPAQRS